jgi:hypothetical protein
MVDPFAAWVRVLLDTSVLIGATFAADAGSAGVGRYGIGSIDERREVVTFGEAGRTSRRSGQNRTLRKPPDLGC